jgi:hypothetical protein
VEHPLPASASPSLVRGAGGLAPAFELKFLLSEAQARAVEDRVRHQLFLDPHADPALGNAYLTTSVYCDTPRFDVYHRCGSFRRRKHRLRRYGDAPGVFLERKAKQGARVRKRRCKIAEAELALLEAPLTTPAWPGHWFHRQLVFRQLRPVCRVRYQRVAYLGIADDHPVRLTFDRQVFGTPARDWSPEPFAGGHPLLTDGVICEFKFCGALPGLFKELIRTMQLNPGGVSKYRLGVEAAGLLPGGRSAHA